ncbi:Di-copper centre-containing protein [Pilatotrama ljubarskyi]|nr:Di-copper centre-containing protein [Pilatotrama ljubarskyi]
MGDHYITAGVVAVDDAGQGVFNRREIVDFMQDDYQWSLYVRALSHMMYDVTEISRASYWQIAGIHGAPYVSYDGAGDDPHHPSPARGYCTHGSVLFPTWHRPYVALIEQEIQRIAMLKAQEYDDPQGRWRNAAIALRQPYWDWASTAKPPQALYANATIEILMPPRGVRTSVDNPFAQYRFPHIPAGFPGPFNAALWTATHRHAIMKLGKVLDVVESLEASLENNFPFRSIGTAALLNKVTTWPAFSNDNNGQNAEPAERSLESQHNNIHQTVGGGPDRGHMSVAQAAAFDPFFWLHHSQTDRLFALWSALHPDAWVTNSHDADGTYTIDPTAAVDENTDLTPFYSSQTQFWTSADLQVPPEGLFGYSYPEFDAVRNESSKDVIRAHIKEQVDVIYPLDIYIKRWIAFDTVARSRVRAAAEPPSVLHWSAHITAKKYALGGSFEILVFLGAVPDDPREFCTSPSYVGSYSAFVNSEPERCANCVRQGNITIGSAVSLNDAIMNAAEVSSFDPDEVVPYLKRELHWRVHTGSGPAIHAAEIEELEVDVSAVRYYLSDQDALQAKEKPIVYHDVTRGRPGGCRHHTNSGVISSMGQ